MPDQNETTHRSSWKAAFVLVLLAAFSIAALAQPVFPELTGRVVDGANLLSPTQEQEISTRLSAHETDSTDQVVVVTLESLQGYEIEEFGYQLGRHWGVGQEGKDNGVLLIVAPNERKVRIEVGRGIEPILTDAITRLIIENGILPSFRRGDFSGGIDNAVTDIIAVLKGDAEELAARARSYDEESELDKFIAILILIVWVVIFISVVWAIIKSIRQGNSMTKSGKRKSKRSSGWTWGSGGGWSSGGGGWSSGGGGFSGGGGGFGGGGSSGGW